MKTDPFLSAGLRCALGLALAATGLTAVADAPKLGRKPQEASSVSASAEPVGRLIIRYKSGTKLASQDAASIAVERQDAVDHVAKTAQRAALPGLRYLKSVAPRLHVVTLDQPVSAAAAQALMARLRADPAVASVQVDRRVRRHAVSDPDFINSGSAYYQWHLQNSSSVPGAVNASSAWDVSTGSGVVVAVLDGGYRPHADLAANLSLPGYDFINGDSPESLWTANDGNGRDANAEDPGDWVSVSDASLYACEAEDSSWHGTHVSGLIGALANGVNGVGLAYGARVLPVRVLGRCGGYISDILLGVRWAAGRPVSGLSAPATPAKVLNLSLGLQGDCDDAAQSVVDEVRSAGVSVVASTGNEGETAITMPANCKGVVAVTAHTREGDSADYANVGPGVAISAPGGGWNTVLSALPGSPRGIASTGNAGRTVPAGDVQMIYQGTSMASPLVASVLALMASARTDLALPTLEALLKGAYRAFPAGGYCATNPDGLASGFCGSGLLDAQKAVAAALSAPSGAADLEVIQLGDASRAAPGTVTSFSIRLRNWGVAPVTGVQLQALMASGLQIQSVTSSSSAVVPSFSASALNATVASLAQGDQLTLNVSALVAASSGRLTSNAQVSSATPEATTVNNQDVLVLTVDATVEPAPESGGGCTAATNGQTDAGLLLLALAALLMRVWRRRAAR